MIENPGARAAHTEHHFAIERATLISALAIPTTLAITFLFLHWTGETLNLPMSPQLEEIFRVLGTPE